MDMLDALALRLRVGNRTVFGIMLISAAFVLILRLLGPLTMRWDLSIQIEAAYRLTQGLGLTNAFTSQLDLNQPPVAEQLTHFPPGLPLLVAGFLWLKMPLAIAFKIIYGLTTVVGWLGWSVIASHCLTRPLKIAGRRIAANYVTAALLPIFYTPPWMLQGTDIFLWSGVPIVLLLLVPTSVRGQQNLSAVLPGLLVVALLSVRYASGFLVLTALGIIVYTDYPHFKSMLKRVLAFMLPLLLVIASAVFFTVVISGDAVGQAASPNLLETHGSRYLESTLLAWIQSSLSRVFYSLSNLFFLTGINIKRLDLLAGYPNIVSDILGFIFFILITVCCLLTLKKKKSFVRGFGAELLTAIAISLISFFIFSVLLAFIVAYSPFVLERYYLPVKTCFIILMYAVASSIKFDALLKYLATLFVLVFFAYNFAQPIYYLFSQDGDSRILKALELSGISEIHAPRPDVPYPSNEVLVIHPKSLELMRAIEQQEPDALFFVQSYPVYMGYTRFDDPQNFRRIPDNSFWEKAYLSEPTKIYWVVNEELCSEICASRGNFNSDHPEFPISSLMSLPNLETIFASPEDKARIMVSELPAGYRFSPVEE
ncbi:MAG: hypothetical protein ACFBSF_00730 [Leptolyngbyaceae cyanobacterium]